MVVLGNAGAGGAGFGAALSYAGRLCLKRKRSSAVSFSATTVSPFGPRPISVIPVPTSPELWNALNRSDVLNT